MLFLVFESWTRINTCYFQVFIFFGILIKYTGDYLQEIFYCCRVQSSEFLIQNFHICYIALFCYVLNEITVTNETKVPSSLHFENFRSVNRLLSTTLLEWSIKIISRKWRLNLAKIYCCNQESISGTDWWKE